MILSLKKLGIYHLRLKYLFSKKIIWSREIWKVTQVFLSLENI